MIDISLNISSLKFAPPPWGAHREWTWISENMDYKKGFLCIPKNSSSGIRRQFNIRKIIKDINLVPKDYEIFAILRNPITRLVSAYIETTEDCKSYPGGRFRRERCISQDIKNILDKLVNNKEMSNIDKFLFYLDKIATEWYFFEPHCIPQVIYLSSHDNKIHPNIKLFKLEEIHHLEKYLGKSIIHGNICENKNLKN